MSSDMPGTAEALRASSAPDRARELRPYEVISDASGSMTLAHLPRGEAVADHPSVASTVVRPKTLAQYHQELRGTAPDAALSADLSPETPPEGEQEPILPPEVSQPGFFDADAEAVANL